MRARTDGSGGWVVLAAVVLCANGAARAVAADEDDVQNVACPIPGEALEASGLRVGEIEIDNQDIFDLEDPEEDKLLFRLMNRLHVLTRPSVIRRQLLFKSGDPFRQQQLDESERILRGTSYLYDAQIVAVSCDEESVDVRVTTQDVWTLKPGFSLSRSGGESRAGFDIQEDNFLGRGGSVRFYRRIDEERRSTEVGYSDMNLGGSWIAFDTTIADNSDGHVFELGLERPFYSLDTRWATGGRVLDENREDPVYSLGDEIGKFRNDIRFFDVYGGWSNGLVRGRVQRWLVGVVHDDRSFDTVPDSPGLALIPEDRRLVYPYVEYQLIQDRFQRAENLDQIRRTEDILLGSELRLRLGLLSKSLGSDRGGANLSAVATRGQGDPAHRLWNLSAHAEGRVEGGEFNNMLIGGAARWYLRQSERRLLYVSLRGDVANNLDLDNPLEIGGDDGLRGYPLRYQRGDARAQFTIEQRYFTDYYLWRLFRVGGAVFFDAGRVWGDNPFGEENQGLLKDIGFGLRFASTRSSMGRMIHIDFAFPLDGDSSIDSFQFLVEGRRSF